MKKNFLVLLSSLLIMVSLIFPITFKAYAVDDSFIIDEVKQRFLQEAKDRVLGEVKDKLTDEILKVIDNKDSVAYMFNKGIKQMTDYLGIDAGKYYLKDKDFIDITTSPDKITDGFKNYYEKQLELFGLVVDKWAKEIDSAYSLEDNKMPLMIDNKCDIDFNANHKTDLNNEAKTSDKNEATIIDSNGKIESANSDEYPEYSKFGKTIKKPKNPGEVVINESLTPLKNSDNEYEVTIDLLAKDKQKHKDIVLVIDCSFSMGTRLYATQEAAVNLVNKIFESENKEDYRIALVSYGKDAVVDCGLIEYDRKDDLISSIKKLFLMDGTNIQAGLHNAKKILEDANSTNGTIVLLSDGEPTYSYALKDRKVLENLNPPFYLGNYLELKNKGVTLEQCLENLKIKKSPTYPYEITYMPTNVHLEAIDYTRVGFCYEDINNNFIKVNNKENLSAIDTNLIYYDLKEMTLLEADLCKKQNIEIFSIAYDLQPEDEELMKLIATTEDHFFSTNNNENKNKNFADISKDVVDYKAHSAYSTTNYMHKQNLFMSNENKTEIDKIYDRISEKILVKETEPAFKKSKIITDINPGFQFVLGSFENEIGIAMYKEDRVVWIVEELKEQIEDDPSIKTSRLKYRIKPLDNIESNQNIFKSSKIIIDEKKSELTNYKVNNVQKTEKIPEEYINIVFATGKNGNFSKDFINNIKIHKNKEVDISEFAPEIIPDENYIFTGWDKSLVGSFDKDQTITAQYRFVGINDAPKENELDYSTYNITNFYSPYQISIHDNKFENKVHFIQFFIGKNEFYEHKGDETLIHNMDVEPIILDSRTLLPLRFLANSIDAEVYWDNTTRTATFIKGEKVIKINIDSSTIVINDIENIELRTKPIIKNGRILLSLTNISKIFEMTNGNTEDGIHQDIEWDNISKSVKVYKK